MRALTFLALFFFQIVGTLYAQQIINLTEPSGQFGLTSSEYGNNQFIQYNISIGPNELVELNIDYGTEKDYDYIYVFECDDTFGNLQQVMSLCGSGQTSYKSSNLKGKLVVQFKSDGAACGKDKGYNGFSISYGPVAQIPLPSENAYPTSGAVIVGGVADNPNIQITDEVGKTMGDINQLTLNYDNAQLLLKSSADNKLGLTYNKISADGSLGIAVNNKLFYTANEHVFSTANVDKAITITAGGKLCLNQSQASRAYINGLLTGEASESFIDFRDESNDYGIAICNGGGKAGSSFFPCIAGATIDENAALYILGNHKGESTGSKGIITFDGRRKGKPASANQVVVEYWSGWGNRLGHITGEGSFYMKKDIEAKGTIRAKEVKVTAQTADFVFEEDYNLPSLEDVEGFISANKHLPEIPSAAKMEEQGVNLGEMNKLLLQKIEELTLYMINQEKRIKELEKKVRYK